MKFFNRSTNKKIGGNKGVGVCECESPRHKMPSAVLMQKHRTAQSCVHTAAAAALLLYLRPDLYDIVLFSNANGTSKARCTKSKTRFEPPDKSLALILSKHRWEITSGGKEWVSQITTKQ